MFAMTGKNKAKTVFIVICVFLFLSAALWFVMYMFDFGILAIPVAVTIALITSLISFFNSHKIVMKISGARPADPQTEKRLHDMMEGICIAAGMEKPKIYIIEDPSPNAFATGRNPKNAVVCVTTGLLETLDYYELEGVMAHELAHIKNYDILLATIVTVMVGIVIILSDFLFLGHRGLFRGGGSRNYGGGGGYIGLIIMVVGLVFIILAPIAGQLMKLALSRNREYLADTTAVEFTRNPAGLVSALEKLDSYAVGVKHANKATESLYIVNPFKDLSNKKPSKWFTTHPPMEKRIEALKNIH